MAGMQPGQQQQQQAPQQPQISPESFMAILTALMSGGKGNGPQAAQPAAIGQQSMQNIASQIMAMLQPQTPQQAQGQQQQQTQAQQQQQQQPNPAQMLAMIIQQLHGGMR